MNPNYLYGNFSKHFYCVVLFIQIRHLVLCECDTSLVYLKNLQEKLPDSDLIDFAEWEVCWMRAGNLGQLPHHPLTLPCCCCCCEVDSVLSDSVRPHRWQPTRLPHPGDSPGKNTGVGCHFLLQYTKVKIESEVAQSCPTLSNPMDWSLPGFSIHGIFQAKLLEWGAITFSIFALEKAFFSSWILSLWWKPRELH